MEEGEERDEEEGLRGGKERRRGKRGKGGRGEAWEEEGGAKEEEGEGEDVDRGNSYRIATCIKPGKSEI